MESPSKVELIKQAIQQVMEEVGSDDDGDDRLLLSKLMSQLEDETSNMSRLEEEERIVKELKKVRRQNVITHCLLSIMIVLTVAWQISEVSIILKLKDGVSHPFRSIGGMLKRAIRPRKENDDTETTSDLIESSPVHDLRIPVLPLPNIDFGSNAQEH